MTVKTNSKTLDTRSKLEYVMKSLDHIKNYLSRKQAFEGYYSIPLGCTVVGIGEGITTDGSGAYAYTGRHVKTYGKLYDVFETGGAMNNLKSNRLRVKLGTRYQGAWTALGRDRYEYTIGMVECITSTGERLAVPMWGW